ncbi:hypothetical protein [Piscinibacter sp.]|uniref:hypothetical protein n=1 Tax=Piscinibacter sp. TaxID=1903157 RepID=UPI002CC8F61D|nr:hypothetical protein [Albitalea sp.]HUG25374.1 hypothetical protein [Albitalea sp.]
MSATTESTFRRAQMLLCGLLLAACAPLAPPSGAAPAPALVPEPASPAAQPAPAPAPPLVPLATPADLATREMLAFHERARQWTGADLAREIGRRGEASAGARASVELALLLGQTRNNGDLARALALLDGLLRSSAPEAAPWQPLARLVAAQLAEQRRIEEQLERQNQQARENQRRVDQLSQKLEALKAIERSLTTRPEGGAAAAPGTRGSTP